MSDGSSPLGLNHDKTALVLIDLQKNILARQAAPYAASEVVSQAVGLVSRCHELGIPVVFVTVDFRPDAKDRLSTPSDSPLISHAQNQASASDGATLAPELTPGPEDIFVVKHQWGAFYGTDLDLQLRRRGIDTILLGGIATNFGVESTARDAWERSYKVVLIEDAMTSVNADAHQFAVSYVFPRLGRVRTTAQILANLQ